MNDLTHLDRFRLGRNFVRLGDIVAVAPTRPGRHNGFDGKVVRIDARDGEVVSVDVVHPEKGSIHPVAVERLSRRAQTVAQARYAERRRAHAGAREAVASRARPPRRSGRRRRPPPPTDGP